MDSAKISSIDALRRFRAALIKFAESAGSALTDADADVRSTLIWLERDQLSWWQSQIRKRHDALERAKEALRHKQLFKASHGGRESVVDEQKAVEKAKLALAEAEQKLVNVRRSIQRLNKQMMEYQGQVQRLSSTVQTDVPRAVADLDRMVLLLDQYVSLRAIPSAAGAAESDESAMTRAAPSPQAQSIDWNSLRARTVSPSRRAETTRGLVSFGPWKSANATVEQQEILATLNLPRSDIAPDQLIVLARDVSESDRIYLERLDPAFPQDSGWYIGPADSPDEPNLIALPVAEVLAMRPDLANNLSLPRGFLLGMDEHGIAAILNDQGRDVWADALAAQTRKVAE